MGSKRTIIVNGSYIARQDIGTQILHAEHVHAEPTSDNVLRTATGSPIEQSSSPVKGREVSDVDFEDVPKAEELPTMEQLSKIFTFKYRQDLGFSLLIDFLRSERDRADFHADSDWARYALTIYEWNPCILQKRPNTFKEWLPKFCELFGRAWVRDYEPNKLQSVKECKIVPFLPLRETR